MPRYVYVCPGCAADATVDHSIHADPDVLCEQCGGLMRRRPAWDGAISLRGDGWASKT